MVPGFFTYYTGLLDMSSVDWYGRSALLGGLACLIVNIGQASFYDATVRPIATEPQIAIVHHIATEHPATEHPFTQYAIEHSATGYSYNMTSQRGITLYQYNDGPIIC